MSAGSQNLLPVAVIPGQPHHTYEPLLASAMPIMLQVSKYRQRRPQRMQQQSPGLLPGVAQDFVGIRYLLEARIRFLKIVLVLV